MDPISDMFIRIKNARRAGHDAVLIPYSKFKHEIARALERAGMVGALERKGKRVRKILEIKLLAPDQQTAFTDVRLLSTPSRRLYSSYKELKPVRRGGIMLLSTPQGVMSSIEARRARVGGQLIAEIW